MLSAESCSCGHSALGHHPLLQVLVMLLRDPSAWAGEASSRGEDGDVQVRAGVTSLSISGGINAPGQQGEGGCCRPSSPGKMGHGARTCRPMAGNIEELSLHRLLSAAFAEQLRLVSNNTVLITV